MHIKMFLTSIAAIVVATPVMADAIREEWPDNDTMLENRIYTDAATESHMGVYADDATAIVMAEYKNLTYDISAGKYLRGGDEGVETECPANSYCTGLTQVEYSESDQGIAVCPTEYALSAAGSSSQNDCYRECTNNDVAHATAVSGGYYYGDNNQCVATECERGYTARKSFVKSSILTDTIGKVGGTSYGYRKNDNSYANNGTGLTENDSGLTERNTWAVYWDGSKGVTGTVYGTARCSTKSGNNDNGTWANPTKYDTLDDETGTGLYCYCNVTGYKGTDGAVQSLLSAWVYRGVSNNGTYCANVCARDCASYTIINSGFRTALFESDGVSPTLASCVANTINIVWQDANADDVAAANAGTVTYGGDIRTPAKAIDKPGKMFIGWKFVIPPESTSD